MRKKKVVMVRLFLLMLILWPLMVGGQVQQITLQVHKAAGVTDFSDTITLSEPAMPGSTIGFSFSLRSSLELTTTPKAVVQTSRRSVDMTPGCETNTEDLDFVSALLLLNEDESGQLVIFVRNLPEEECTLTLTEYFFENRPFEVNCNKINQDNRFECPCEMPSYMPRSVWGAAYQLTNDIYRPPATITDVTHLIIHHSATSNTSNNWPGVVASIFNYHANTNQWQDIGYNWLIDPEGNLYQGRGGGEDVRGAHMCGYNDNSMAVCMLGTFTNVDPDPRALATLDSLLAYKSCQKNFDPTSSADIVSYPGHMFRISGHRDGCAPNYTECPGVRLHAFLPNIRQNTYRFMEENCSVSSSEDDKLTLLNSVVVTTLRDELQIQSEERGQMVLSDISGLILWESTFEKGLTSRSLRLPGGIYFLKINIGESTITKKIVIP